MSETNQPLSRRCRLMEALQDRPIEKILCDRALRADLEAEVESPPEGSEPLLTRTAWEDLCELVSRKEEAANNQQAGPELFFSTDQVVLVPGFMASALMDSRRRSRGLIWVSPLLTVSDRLGTLRLGPYDGSEKDLDSAVQIQADGPLPIVYDLLRLALEVRRYTVEVFAYDWRKDLEMSAHQLADRLKLLEAGGKPIHLVAHSQGALVARRALQQLGAKLARRLVRHLVLLGPANFGSFSAALGLAGGHDLIDILRRFAIEPVEGLRNVLTTMTGLYQLLPWDASRAPWLQDHDLGRLETWGPAAEGLDTQRLDRFFGWGRELDTRFFDDRTTVILAESPRQPTIGGLVFEGNQVRPALEQNLQGDGTIPHSCAVLPGVPTFLASGVDHSLMATSRKVINAVRDVLADRVVSLPETSSNPEDYFQAIRKPKTPAFQLESTRCCGIYPSMNGSFLKSYDRSRAQNERCEMAQRYRQYQISPGTMESFSRPPLASPLATVSFQVSSATPTKPSPITRELILEASQLLPFHFLRDGDRLGRAVVKIQRGDGSAGTGFLISPDILITNHHVLPNKSDAASAFALANYERRPPDDASGKSVVARLDPTSMFVTNSELDFTFCGVQGLEGLNLGAVPLDRNSLTILRNERVNIVQHPRGRPKEVAIQDNHVVYDDNIVLHYSCDTEPGSSGSPVFNNQWSLVALHHASVQTENSGGRIAPSTGNDEARYLNEGIRLSAIAAWLESAEAETTAPLEHLNPLRNCFRGLDPQIGFFGALGCRAQGQSTAEFLVELYRGGPGVGGLDVGFWDLGGPSPPLPRRLAEVSRAIADMGVDLWCLAHVGTEVVHALRDHLSKNFELDYQVLIEDSARAAPMAVLYRQDRALTVEPLNPPEDWTPACLRVQIATGSNSDDQATVHLLPISGSDANGIPESSKTDKLIQALGQRSQHNSTDQDWALLGGFAPPIDPDTLTGTGYELLLAAGHGQAVALLTGERSQVERVFVTPNLESISDPSDRLIITRDRELPPSALAFGKSQPIALRLALRHLPTSPSAHRNKPIKKNQDDETKKPPSASAEQAEITSTSEKLDLVHLENALTELLRPVISRLLNEGQSSQP